jgi:hypothetical protein
MYKILEKIENPEEPTKQGYVRCKIVNDLKADSEIIVTLHQDKYNLLVALNSLQTNAGINKFVMQRLWETIEAYAQTFAESHNHNI